MSDWPDTLAEIVRLNAAVRPADAENRFKKVIDDCPADDLASLAGAVDIALLSFYPKRRKALQALLDKRLSEISAGPVMPSVQPQSPETVTVAVEERDPVPAADDWFSDAEFERRLQSVSVHLVAVRPAEAEGLFQALVEELADDELLYREQALREIAEEFLPKRRRAIEEMLDEAVLSIRASSVHAPPLRRPPPAPDVDRDLMPEPEAGPQPEPKAEAKPHRPIPMPPPRHPSHQVVSNPRHAARAYNFRHFTDDLDELSRIHIFQWATFYRDVLSEYFAAFLEADEGARVLDTSKSALLHHASEIFTKGYIHITDKLGLSGTNAVAKSLSGLQRFIDLPLEFYSARLPDAHRNESVRPLRRLCSAMLCGILVGYSEAQLDQTGREILPRFPRAWAHVLPFLTAEDLREVLTSLEPGLFTDGVADTLLLLAEYIDKFIDRDPVNAPLPALAQYVIGMRRLDVSLQLRPDASKSRSIDVQCYQTPDLVERHHIEEASARAVSVIIARLRSDLRGAVAAVDRLAEIVVPVGDAANGLAADALLRERLDSIVYSRAADSKLDRPITYNFARNFPLESPFLPAYNHVYRGSVRALMQSFERRNGVRLWCSVRRSGKTTACASDLGSTTGQTAVVAQTCDDTGQMAAGGVFYSRVVEALSCGRHLSDSFVVDAVGDSLVGGPRNAARFVFVLDEYETLFGTLSSYLVGRPELRYMVVQPLLNQLVRFTRDNLLVFMGQQPNAHNILLDQNQLSPVIEQDSFPLFTHDDKAALSGEFYELLRKVMTSNVDIEPEFVNMVYGETGGHPFLTVKVLVAFMDWLISSGYRVSDLNPVRADLFATFATQNLTLGQILRSDSYDFFQGAAEDHLSAKGRDENPWLHGVYTILRALRLDSPETLSVSEDDYNMLAIRAGIKSPSRLLTAAKAANFLVYEHEIVRPRIPILARIAAAVPAG